MENLGSGLRDQTMELLLVVLQPGADSGDEPIVHLGHEFIFCLEGAIEYEIRGDSYLLDAGDSLIFGAYLPLTVGGTLAIASQPSSSSCKRKRGVKSR
jgi:uncharacterized cupin superfamily protein